MFRTIEVETADEAWLTAARWFEEESLALQGGRGGQTTEILHVGLAINSPRDRWVASRTPPINPAFAIAEVIWMMCGRDDSRFVNYFNRKLPVYCGDVARYHGAYGYRLRRRFGVDQLDRAYHALNNNPHSRQVVLQIWDAPNDLPHDTGAPASMDIPCNLVSMLKIRDGRLQWTQIMRSNDLFLGLPHNIIQFTSLQEIMAGWLEVEVGSYHHLSDSLHLYERDNSKLWDPSIAVPRNTDDLAVPKVKSGHYFAELARVAELVTDESNDSRALVDALAAADLPGSYRNLLSIVVAEGLRRRGDLYRTNAALEVCTNPCLSLLFRRWLRRFPDSCLPESFADHDTALLRQESV